MDFGIIDRSEKKKIQSSKFISTFANEDCTEWTMRERCNILASAMTHERCNTLHKKNGCLKSQLPDALLILDSPNVMCVN